MQMDANFWFMNSCKTVLFKSLGGNLARQAFLIVMLKEQVMPSEYECEVVFRELKKEHFFTGILRRYVGSPSAPSSIYGSTS